MTKRLLYAMVVLVLLSACSDDSAFEGISENDTLANIKENCSSALDDRNYAYVISQLSLVYTTTALDPEVSRLLASAYMGKAGLDFTRFMKNISGVSSHPFDIMSSIIASPYETDTNSQRYLNGNAVIGKTEKGEETYEIDLLDTLERARNILERLRDEDLASDDDLILLGLASAVHFILNVGNQTAVALNYTMRYFLEGDRQYGIVPVPINTDAYHYYKMSQQTDWKYFWFYLTPDYYAKDTTGDEPSSYQRDLENIRNAVEAFDRRYSEDNDIRDALDDFLRSALNVSQDTTVTEDLILEYNSAGIYGFVNRLADAG